MKNTIFTLLVISLFISCSKEKEVWVFVMAGQSNMAGRGLVAPQDTISNSRVLVLNKQGSMLLAKEPLHFYEPTMVGLDCGLSFGKRLIKDLPDHVSVLLLPTAVGGSSISQWLGDSIHRNVKLLSNFKEKVEIGKQYGTVKGVLWHQGESDANEKGMKSHKENLSKLFKIFRTVIGNENTPIIVGELGSFSKYKENWQKINEQINKYANSDLYCEVVSTSDLKDKGDRTHFNAAGQRTLGKRFASEFLDSFVKNK